MPRNMLISRKRLLTAEQPAPLENTPHMNSASHLEESQSFTTEDEEDDELIMDCDDNITNHHSQPIVQTRAQDSLDHHNGADQQVDTLTNAIIYFVSLFNQQQQLQNQQQQQQQSTATQDLEPIEPPLSLDQPVIIGQPAKKEHHTRRSATSGQKSQLINHLRRPKQQSIIANVPKVEQNSQQIFLNNEDLTDPQLSNQSQSKRSSSGSGCGSDDNFVHYCVDCGKRYSTSSNLARHRQTHRDVTDKKAKKCPECDKIYVSMPAFSMHLRTHNQGCICSECGKSFSRPWLLQGHMRTHTGEKPFKCKICEKAFADKSNLRAHVQTHSTTKPYVCDRCNKAFALKSYLCKHVDSTCMRAANGSQKEPLNLKVLYHSKHETRNRSGQC